MASPLLSGRVVGADAVRFQLAEATRATARARLGGVVKALGYDLRNLVITGYLSGQALNKRTGRLQNSINVAYTETETAITATVGTALVYGAAWELGFDRSASVRAHVRRVSSRDIRAAVDGGTSKRLIAKGITFVREGKHTGALHEAARPFLRPALAQMGSAIQERIAFAMRGI